MRCAITVSLVAETRTGPFVYLGGLAEGCREAAKLGFDAIELFPASPAEFPTDDLKRLLSAHPLALAAVGTGAGWLRQQLTLTSPDAAVRQRARDFISGMLARAGEFGAPVIVGSMQGRWSADVSREDAVAWLAEALAELGTHAQRAGTTLFYEPLNRYETNLFNRVIDTADWLRATRPPAVKILADLFHMNIEESDSAAALRHAGDLVGHVHFADSNRRAIGFGQTPVAPIIAALRAIEYRGYLSAEIFPLPDASAAAAQSIAAFRQATKG